MIKRGAAILLTIVFTILQTGNVFATEVISSKEIVIENGQIVENRNHESESDTKVIVPVDGVFNKLTDYLNGYSVNYPNHMYVDVHLSPINTVIFDDAMRIEIYYDNLNGTLANVWNYIYYSNGFIRNDKDHMKAYEQTYKINDYTVHILKWSRNKLSRVPNDKNYYLSAEIIKNPKEVYTLFFKSTAPIDDADCLAIIDSFKVTEKKGQPYIQKIKTNHIEKKWNDETKNFYDEHFMMENKMTWGIFDNYAPDYMSHFKKTESLLDYKFKFLVRYHNFPSETNINNIKDSLEKAYDDGRYVELTLQTTQENEDGNIVYDILNGEYDAYFTEYAQMLKSFGHPVMFRLNNEMNGDWCLYSSYHTSKDTLIYKALYEYLHLIFEENGVDNVLWIWNPHDRSFPDFKWNHALAYYPGDEYVDIIGLTGYNTGTYYQGEVWRGFNEIYDELYEVYNQYFDKPFMITEFSSSSVGGDKDAWIKEMFENINKYEKIKAVIWWNGCDYDSEGRAARIYRLDQSPSMIYIFRQELQKFK